MQTTPNGTMLLENLSIIHEAISLTDLKIQYSVYNRPLMDLNPGVGE